MVTVPVFDTRWSECFLSGGHAGLEALPASVIMRELVGTNSYRFQWMMLLEHLRRAGNQQGIRSSTATTT